MPKSTFNRNFAVLVGINNYQNDIPPLETAVPDACKLAEILQKQHEALKPQYQAQNKYEVQLFLNQRASLNNLNQLIADFKQGQIPFDNEKVTVTKDDRVLFYFAGHGIAKEALENQEGPVGYLIPQDATENSNTYLPMQDLHDALNALPCRHMLAILDCCFAGAFRWSSLKRDIVPKVKVYKERYDRFISDAAWQVITSAADDQKALDSWGVRGTRKEGNEVHSPFAQALFNALRGTDQKADTHDGIMTATKLYSYLRDQVEVLTEKHFKRQTPTLCPLRKHDKGEFIFLLPNFDRDKLDDAPPLNKENNPYLGLQSYDENNSHLFFGRENLIQELYQKAIANEQVVNKQPLTIVLGASGTGKSSLMKAGLLKRLRDSQEQKFEILDPMRPGESPLKALAQVCLPITDETAAKKMVAIKQLSQELKKSKHILENLIRNCKNQKTEILQVIEQLTLREELLDIEYLKFTDDLQQSLQNTFSNNNDQDKQFIDEWINKFKERQKLHEELRKPIDDLSKALEETQKLTTIIESWSSIHSNTKLLLPIDQFEELITLCKSDKEQEQFQNLIKNAIAKYPDKIHVVITLRLDFEAQFQTSVLKDFWNEDTRFVVPLMNQDEFRSCIEKPASEKVVYFDPPSLVDELINEVVQMPGGLPLLSFTLSELYLKYLGDRTRDNRALTKKDYEELGRVVGSLTQRANQEHKQLLEKDSAYENSVRRVMLRMISLQGGELARRQVPKSELVYPDKEESDRVQTVIKRFSEARLIVEGSNSQGEPYVEPAHDALVLGWDRLRNWIKTKKQQEKLALQQLLTPSAEEWKNNKRAVGFLWDNNPRILLLQQVLKSDDMWLNQLEKEFVEFSLQRRRNNLYRLIGAVATFIVGVSTAAIIAFWQRNEAIKGQIGAFTSTSQSYLSSNQELDALFASLKAAKLQTENLGQIGNLNQIMPVIAQAVYGARERNRLDSHTATVKSVAFSPDGQLIASASTDQTVKLWNTDGTLKATLPKNENSNSFTSVSFSPDGQIIAATNYNRTVTLWNRDGTIKATLEGHTAPPPYQLGGVNSVSFSPNSQLIATAGDDGTVRFWNTKGEEFKTLTLTLEGGNWGTSASFSPNGRLIAVAEANITTKDNKEYSTITILNGCGQNQNSCNLSQLVKQKIVVRHRGLVKSVSFSPDSQFLVSASSNGSIVLWSSGQPIRKFNHGSSVNSVSFSPNGQFIISAGDDGTIKLWSLDGKEFATFNHGAAVNNVTFSPDSQFIVSGGDDNIVKIWSTNLSNLKTLQSEKDSQVSFSPDGQLIASVGCFGNNSRCTETAKLWLRDGTLLKTFEGVGKINFSPDGQIIALVQDNIIELWNRNLSKIAILSHSYSVGSFSFSPDSQLIASTASKTDNDDSLFKGDIILWGRDGKKIKTFQAHAEKINRINFSPDGKFIASASDDTTVKIWNRDGKLVRELQGHKENVIDVSFSPDGKIIASISWDLTVKLWNLDGRNIKQWPWYKDDPNVAVSVSESDMLGDRASYLRFSPDSKNIFTLGEGRIIKLWDRDGNLLNTFPEGRKNSISSVSFSPNGQTLASISENSIKLWDFSSNTLLATLKGHEESSREQGDKEATKVTNVNFSPDGETLASVDSEGKVTLWNFNFKDMRSHGCVLIHNYLKNNPNVRESDRHLCDDVPPTTANSNK
ncbi:WD40 repeat-containing protein (plasmid) [Cylindrospermum stagnale PCC 7417]|uniref:WD40 repeat-containing protein n=1 Tax=Cylindrospermum stagnale PCC 7417 TaxID=56107 RepID=K9X9R5_9NOST|nr:caspase family protein [Cylindrospermum stagnale]AFZ28392.1 WD40 repeat-containing protein [Cylindrospermum stagnale PCC 7417]